MSNCEKVLNMIKAVL